MFLYQYHVSRRKNIQSRNEKRKFCVKGEHNYDYV